MGMRNGSGTTSKGDNLMGCSDRDESTVEELAYKKRESEVVSAIRAVPLSKLNVGDSLFIHGAFFHRNFGFSLGDIERMEEILNRARAT